LKQADFEKFRSDFIDEAFSLSDKKRIEYTEGNAKDNVLWNFEDIANKLNLEPEDILAVYLNKHISSLNNYFKDKKVYSESIQGRVCDIVNYLILFLAMLEKKNRKINE
tara:strand:- start:126 stop:452 length:327 start_codon:yes stop_codon:yes gene_type:complete